MSEPCFQLRGVSRRLSQEFRLEVDDLTIQRGETLALVGPTGAGKTTLLRLLTGHEYPDEGVIRFAGAALDRSTPLAQLRRIAMVHQRPILQRGTVESIVEYGLRVRGKGSAARVEAILNWLQLRPLGRQHGRTLSGGQTQLVALARALVLEPDVLLLDEPTANLDPARVALVENAIAEARASHSMTVVWATHNLFQARRISQRVALLLNGCLVEVADNPDFFERPRDPRAKAFVEGKMVY